MSLSGSLRGAIANADGSFDPHESAADVLRAAETRNEALAAHIARHWTFLRKQLRKQLRKA